MASIGTNIRNAVAKQKGDQLLKAEGDWQYLQSSLNELYAAQQSGDQQAAAAAQKKVDVTLGDPKKLKNMAKALNQDWLNPEKTTVYGEALKKTIAQTEQKAQQEGKKAQAAQGLKSMMQHLIGKATQPQLSDEQKKQMSAEIQSKAPTTQGAFSPADAEKMAMTVKDLALAQKDMRAAPEKYDIKTIADPSGATNPDGSPKQIIVATDTTDPTKPYIEVKSATGEKARPGEKKYVDDGKLELVQGIPTGRVKRGGQWIAPGQEGYTKEDTNAVKLGMDAQGLSQKQKDQLMAIRGESYARARAVYTFHDVTDTQTGEVRQVSAMDMAKEPGRYTGASEQEKVSARDSVHESLTTNFKALGDSLDKLPNGLDTETQATIKMALRTDNPGVLETLLVNKIKQNAPDGVLQYLTDMKAMQEDIMVLRSVGGMGAGSDTMRNAMVNLIPGPGSSSQKEAKMQIKAAQRTTESLFARRPQSLLPDTRDKKTAGGEMETQTYNGATYQRKKGSNDPWTLSKPK
ncbi:MAG TPA: hypothetical protein VH187_18720 [Scandinavium sp.]|jgi:hypothetical protein|uniref:hypothetical protein n=1 Tax=Scandinavium sp. TaxID=2830653 RepID=UPI002E2FA6BB|nr:hypothetical protein [Scandinavium sp.]HEX4503172.1 hypothetical protein [Scandinavium sp.]